MKRLSSSISALKKSAFIRTTASILHSLCQLASLTLIKIIAHVGFIRVILYGLCSSAFKSEFASVAMGKLLYTKNVLPTVSGLRRNIHRIEKGLIARPRKERFAEEYIEETVSLYNQLLSRSKCELIDKAELSWASDILEHYFKVVSPSLRITTARNRFFQLPNRTDTARIPYAAKQRPRSHISYDQLYDLSRKRRSIRWYQNHPISHEDIDKAITIAIQAPSACNRQSFHFRIFDDQLSIKKISELSIGMSGFSSHIPALAVVTSRFGAYNNERDRHVIYIDAALSAMSFMYALEVLGMSSCPINWPGLEGRNRKLARLLNLAADECTIMLIAFGFPDPEGLIPYSEKRSIEFMRSYTHL